MINTSIVNNNKFSWKAGLNISLPNNKLLRYPNLASTSIFVVGQPVDVVKVYAMKGVDETTGLYKYVDNHGDGTFTPSFREDRTQFVNTSPRFYGGIQNELSYKGFTLNVFIQFVKQKEPLSFFHNSAVFPGQFYASYSNQPVAVLDRWQIPGDVKQIQKFSTSSDQFVVNSDYSYGDASYLRLKNISISYQLSGIWKNKFLSDWQVYFQGQNVVTITGYKGLDPENGSSVIPSLPPLQQIVFGLKLGI